MKKIIDVHPLLPLLSRLSDGFKPVKIDGNLLDAEGLLKALLNAAYQTGAQAGNDQELSTWLASRPYIGKLPQGEFNDWVDAVSLALRLPDATVDRWLGGEPLVDLLGPTGGKAKGPDPLLSDKPPEIVVDRLPRQVF